MWALGFNGNGTILKTILDTEGKDFKHDYNWFDGVRMETGCKSSCGCSLDKPCDDQSHGTHTIGTAVGGVDRKIGVAPGLKWICC
eukprot:gene9442-1648_t